MTVIVINKFRENKAIFDDLTQYLGNVPIKGK